jgi:hypothetical protein
MDAKLYVSILDNDVLGTLKDLEITKSITSSWERLAYIPLDWVSSRTSYIFV